jgi:hypothetical protein
MDGFDTLSMTISHGGFISVLPECRSAGLARLLMYKIERRGVAWVSLASPCFCC